MKTLWTLAAILSWLGTAAAALAGNSLNSEVVCHDARGNSDDGLSVMISTDSTTGKLKATLSEITIRGARDLRTLQVTRRDSLSGRYFVGPEFNLAIRTDVIPGGGEAILFQAELNAEANGRRYHETMLCELPMVRTKALPKPRMPIE